MKNLKILAALALTMAVCATGMSCKKDNGGDEGPTATLKWNGKEYPVVVAQNWYNTVTLRDMFFFRTSTASIISNPDQLYFYVDIPTTWTNGYRMWNSTASSSYSASIITGNLDILIPDRNEESRNPGTITGGFISVVGGNSGYDIGITMTVRYFDPQLGANNTGSLEIYYKGKMTLNETLQTYLDDLYD